MYDDLQRTSDDHAEGASGAAQERPRSIALIVLTLSPSSRASAATLRSGFAAAAARTA